MQAELHAPVALIYGFLLVLSRVAGAFIFVPLPGIRSAPDMVRIVLILAITISLFPVWPVLPGDPAVVEFAGWIAVEAGFGICIGLLVGLLTETASMFGHLCGLHAGFSFVSTIDPNTQAESPVLSILAETVAGLLFVTLGLHRYVIRIFAHSLETLPPGQFLLNPRWSEVVIHAASSVFSLGLRLAFPVVALLVMVDVTLALLGRIESSLQIMSFATPLKMLASIALVSIVLTLFPSIYEGYAKHLLQLAAAIAR
jgi:flagellar biosynthesis protein FliR